MPQYEIREDSGADKIIESDTIEEALETAQEWASEGSYDERVTVKVYVAELDEDGEITDNCLSGETQAGPEPRPEVTECGEDDEDHEWGSPLELVGGLSENPGVFSSGTRFDYHEVCRNCGTYKHSWDVGSQRNPGENQDGVEYERADERSLAWVAEFAAEV